MGGSESRKVSFGLDEREQVRVLQGIRVRRPGLLRGRWWRRRGAQGRERGWGRPGGQDREVRGEKQRGREERNWRGWRGEGVTGERWEKMVECLKVAGLEKGHIDPC